MRRQINNAGCDLIKQFEGCRLTAYPDPATGGDPWTVGYGSTGPHVKPGLTITQEQADGLLRSDLVRFEDGVAKLAPVSTDNQFAALVSFAFNLGLGNLGSSTLLRRHNEGNYAQAANEFGKWNRANKKVMAGLTRRRAAESAIYRKAP